MLTRCRAVLVRGFRGIVSGSRSLTTAVGRGYSPSQLLIGAVVAAGTILILSSVVASYFGNDVFASLSFYSDDARCPNDNVAAAGVGNHCFGDYYQVVDFARLANPWVPYQSNYSPSGMLPNMLFGWIGDVAGNPRAGLLAFLGLLAVSLAIPALWASKGKVLSLRIFAVAAFGLLTIPALGGLDRGNNAPLAVPALLWFLVALRRGRLTQVAVAIGLATLIRPQFVILIAVLLALRKWRLSLAAFTAIGVSNLLAFLVWPGQFPRTLVDFFNSVARFGRQYSMADSYPPNVSFGRGLYEIDSVVRRIFGGTGADPWTAHFGGYIGVLVAAAFVVFVIVLGRRLPPLIGAIIVVACASMFLGATWSYNLAFCLPVAAVLLRDPPDLTPDPHRWSGALDRQPATRTQGWAMGLISLAVAASLMRLVLPQTLHVALIGSPTHDDILATTASLAPVLWLAAVTTALAAWGLRRPPDRSVAAPDADAALRD